MQNNNPLFRPRETETPKEEVELIFDEEQTEAAGNVLTDLYHGLLHESMKIQKEFNALLSEHFRATDENTLIASLTVLGIAFIYGILHALGPGHGKTVVTLYCISNKERYTKALELGFLIAVIHALSALLITFFIYFILDVLFSKTFNDVVGTMTQISGTIIIAVGFYMLYEHYQHSRQCNADERNSFFRNSKRGPLMIAASVGLVPCPGVMTVLLFSIALEKYLLGVLSAIVMSIGMGIAISLTGAAAVKAKEKTGLDKGWFQSLLGYGGAVMIMMLGVVLLAL